MYLLPNSLAYVYVYTEDRYTLDRIPSDNHVNSCAENSAVPHLDQACASTDAAICIPKAA